MHQISGSVDSTLRLLDLADEGRFLLMSHVWRLDKRDESRERRGPARKGLERQRSGQGYPVSTARFDQRCAGQFVRFSPGNSSALFASRCYLLPVAAT
jgi:hypothetical protein